MTATFRAEWLKLTTARTFYWLLAGAAAVAAIGAFSTTTATSPSPWHLTDPIHEQMMWVLGAINGGIFALIVGARAFTDEFRHRTLAHTYIADPRRARSTVAKAASAAGAGALVGTVSAAAIVLVATAMAALSGGTIEFHTSDLPAVAGFVTAMGLWGIIGAGFGALVRHQVAVVAGALLWILMLENLGSGLLDDAARYLPGQTVHAMAQSNEGLHALAPPLAAILMAAYAALFIGTALATTRRRDLI